MATSETLHFEELDANSREYLLQVRDNRGRGMPGIFVPQTNYLPGLGCFFGVVILVAAALIAWWRMMDEPLAVAMIQTAGLLIGGWLIVAAFRIWGAGKSSKYAGHFVYADAETLWECKGSYVTVTDIYNIVEARGVQNFHEGKYQNTAVSVLTSDGTLDVTVKDEERGRLLLVFLNVVAWLRGGGDGKEDEQDFKKLPAAVMGGAAKEHALTGSMPSKLTLENLEIDVDDVPVPKKEGRASGSLIWYLIIIAAGVIGVFGFREVNAGLRDDKLWQEINDVPDQDDRAPWLRAYLNDKRNTKYREAAREMLRGIYQTNIDRIKRGDVLVGVGFNVPPGNPGMPNPGGQNQVRADPAQLDGLAEVLLSLVDQPLPLITVSVKEVGARGGDVAAREKTVREHYTKQVLDGVGEKLILFAEAPADVPGLIDIAYEPDSARRNVTFTVNFRRSPDDDKPAKTAQLTVATSGDPVANMTDAARQLGERTAGPKKQRIQQINLDF